MRKRFVIVMILLGVIIPASYSVHAQQVHDYSLSPEESMQVPDKPGPLDNAPRSNYGQFVGQGSNSVNQGVQPLGGINNGTASQNPYGTAPQQNPYATQPAARFMDGYCDPNFHSAVTNACLDAQKQQACQVFQQLPADAQAVLDQAIGCGVAAGNGSVPDPSCKDSDHRRLQLLQHYESDTATSHALLNLPDAVLNASANCTQGNR